jgi:hypothetical protein
MPIYEPALAEFVAANTGRRFLSFKHRRPRIRGVGCTRAARDQPALSGQPADSHDFAASSSVSYSHGSTGPQLPSTRSSPPDSGLGRASLPVPRVRLALLLHQSWLGVADRRAHRPERIDQLATASRL